ncbi:hypothetical protein JN535_04890 [Cellulosimicrobium cellulans]|uniref:hypothetical protein n=1 Tax=Cellulosimicrobium cellulans TaxID=1710 RepID=UPI001964AB17|nr:hypothetical protein [Cellulosimicrobium cellulans]MBN0039512.1 hypothetical protein [Cellulosimicrobium cellulans]
MTSDRRGRRRGHGLAAALFVAVLTACGGPGDMVTACPAIGYVPRLEVRLDDSWPDRDAYGVAVSCVGAAASCGLVRDGTIRVAPEPIAAETVPVHPSQPNRPDDPDEPEAPETSPEPTVEDTPAEPSRGEWTGSALNGPVGPIVVRVVEVASGDVVVEQEVDPEFLPTTGDFGAGCGGPSVATVEIADPRA